MLRPKYRHRLDKNIINKIIPILKKHGIRKAGIFGSYARGEHKRNSDIDILIKLAESKNLLDFVGVKLELEEELGRKVDLVEYDAIKPRIKQRILKEEINILWKEI